jgi:hypothetical protein
MIYKLEYSIYFYLCYDINFDLRLKVCAMISNLYMFGKKLMMIIKGEIIYFSYHKHHESLTHVENSIQD